MVGRMMGLAECGAAEQCSGRGEQWGGAQGMQGQQNDAAAEQSMRQAEQWAAEQSKVHRAGRTMVRMMGAAEHGAGRVTG